jgi:hypothetical protein
MAATARALGVDATLAATVVRVSPAVDPQTMLGTVRLAIDPKSAEGKGLKVGDAATAQIVIARRPGLRVPATALRRSTVGADEAVVCEGSVARVRAVTIGRRIDGEVEIAKGVKPGEQIVVDHLLGLEDGQALKLGGKGAE